MEGMIYGDIFLFTFRSGKNIFLTKTEKSYYYYNINERSIQSILKESTLNNLTLYIGPILPKRRYSLSMFLSKLKFKFVWGGRVSVLKRKHYKMCNNREVKDLLVIYFLKNVIRFLVIYSFTLLIYIAFFYVIEQEYYVPVYTEEYTNVWLEKNITYVTNLRR